MEPEVMVDGSQLVLAVLLFALAAMLGFLRGVKFGRMLAENESNERQRNLIRIMQREDQP